MNNPIPSVRLRQGFPRILGCFFPRPRMAAELFPTLSPIFDPGEVERKSVEHRRLWVHYHWAIEFRRAGFVALTPDPFSNSEISRTIEKGRRRWSRSI